MPATYTTADGDMIDRICWRHYGTSRDTVELVLDANPWLARHPARLPRGLVIELPDQPTADPRQALVKLWD